MRLEHHQFSSCRLSVVSIRFSKSNI